MNDLNSIDDGLWIADQPLRYLGVEMGARMTVLRIPDSKELVVVSPIQPTTDLCDQLRTIGTVSSIVAPNLLHHLFIQDFQLAFPRAKLYGPPGLQSKRPEIQFDGLLEENKTYPWSDAAKHHIVQGFPKCNECVLYLPHLKTLIVSDLGFHICNDKPFLTRTFFKALGHFERFGWSSLEKRLYIKDKHAFAESMQRICNWDFDKIVMAHGLPILENGKQLFKNAFG